MAILQYDQTWGNWVLDVDELVLKHSGAAFEVALEDMVNSAYVLNSIVELSVKPWASMEDVGNLVRALDELFELKANICSDSQDRRLNAREHLLAVLPDSPADQPYPAAAIGLDDDAGPPAGIFRNDCRLVLE